MSIKQHRPILKPDSEKLNKAISLFVDRIENKKLKRFVATNKRFIEIEPSKVKARHKDVFYNEFNLKVKKEARIITPIGIVKVQPNHYNKLKTHEDKHRKNFIRYIRPTLERPNEIREENGEQVYLKLFFEHKIRLHITIVKVKKDGIFYVTNIPISRIKKWEDIKEKGSSVYELPQVCK